MSTFTRLIGAALCCFLFACEPLEGDARDGSEPEAGGKADDGAGTDADTGRDLHTSGTRIRAQIASTPDGASQFLGWYDTELDLDCSFIDPGDGVLRCLPTDLAHFSGLFADSSCTQRIAAVHVSCAAVPLFVGVFEPTCGAARHYHHTGPQFTGTLYAGGGGGCTSWPSSPVERYYRIDAEIPLSTFQTVTVSVE